MFDQFKIELAHRLKGEMPGHHAHRKVMQHRKAISNLDHELQNARQSAVLILLYPKQSILHTVFILRPVYDGVHSGQIAFPGGAMEQEDPSLMHTALREAREELSIQTEELDVLGKVSSLYVPPSNFLIAPYVAFQPQAPRFNPDPYEVESVLECPLTLIKGEDKLITSEMRLRNSSISEVKGFQLQDRLIWGATAMILKEFSEILEDIKAPIESK